METKLISESKTKEKVKFFFQFNNDKAIDTKITAKELNFVIKGENSIEFHDKKGNVFKIFGKSKNK
jgi:hypothetical protein